MRPDPVLILEVAAGGAVARQLEHDPPGSVRDGAAVLVRLEADEAGRLEAPDVGEVVLSVLSPETFAREPDEVRRVIARAGTGTEPLVIVVEAASELRAQELEPIVEAARHSRRPVVLRVTGDG